MQAHSQSWTVLWNSGIFSDLLPRKRRRVRRYNRTFWAPWFWIATVGWHWQECLEQQHTSWGVKLHFNPISILTMHWNGSQSTGTPGLAQGGHCRGSVSIPHTSPLLLQDALNPGIHSALVSLFFISHPSLILNSFLKTQSISHTTLLCSLTCKWKLKSKVLNYTTVCTARKASQQFNWNSKTELLN